MVIGNPPPIMDSGSRVVYDFLNEIGIFLGFEQDGMGP